MSPLVIRARIDEFIRQYKKMNKGHAPTSIPIQLHEYWELLHDENAESISEIDGVPLEITVDERTANEF